MGDLLQTGRRFIFRDLPQPLKLGAAFQSSLFTPNNIMTYCTFRFQPTFVVSYFASGINLAIIYLCRGAKDLMNFIRQL